MVDSGIISLAEKIQSQYRYYSEILSKFNKQGEKPIIHENDWHLYSLNHNQDKMFIMQNPGEGLNKKQWQEERRKQIQLVSEWRRGQVPEQLADAICHMQIGLQKWLSGNCHFHRFFEILSKENIIEATPCVKKYIDDTFTRDFYVTDLFKYRVATGKLGNALLGNNDEKKDFRGQLMRDLEGEIQRVNPRLIFVFSTRAWEVFYDYFSSGDASSQIQPVDKKFSCEECRKVTEVQGLPFKLRGNRIVIPMCHFSPRYYNMLIKDSYFRYFEESLKANRKEILTILS